MSFIYPRTVSVTRPAAQTGVGAIGYGGTTQASETAVAGAQNVPASIQHEKEGQRPQTGLPQDVAKRTYWKIFIPFGSVAKGTIKDRDIVTDDESVRYSVAASYWNSLGYALLCERLET